MSIHRWDVATDGPFSEPGLRRKLEDLGCIVTTYVYEPGTRFPEHTHDVDKVDAVVSGRFEMTMGGQRFELGAGDWVAVPRGVRHAASVIGSEPVVSLDGMVRSR
jgi:quercetin dioxygenase-like cupin family protein